MKRFANRLHGLGAARSVPIILPFLGFGVRRAAALPNSRACSVSAFPLDSLGQFLAPIHQLAGVDDF
jgi:hypothetical protein